MKSTLPKVLHRVAGRPMLGYAMALARHVATNTVAVVVGHGIDQVRAYLSEEKEQGRACLVVEQTEQLGTGHAVQQAYPALTAHSSSLASQYVIMCGDTPLLTADTLSALVAYHQAEGATLTLLSTNLLDPGGYGCVGLSKIGMRHQMSELYQKLMPGLMSSMLDFWKKLLANCILKMHRENIL